MITRNLLVCTFMAMLSVNSMHAEANSPETMPGVDISQEELKRLLDLLEPAPLDDGTIKAVAQGQDINLSPEEILALRQLKQTMEIAWKQQITPPELLVNTQKVNLSAVQAPIQVNVRNGYDTFIEFYDITGKPWPALAEPLVGAKELFTATVLSDSDANKKSHIIRLAALQDFGDSTLTIHLRGITESINIRLVNNPLSTSADYKRIFTLPIVNQEVAEALFAHQDNTFVGEGSGGVRRLLSPESMEGFLSMAPPSGAISIPVLSGGDVFAWMFKGSLYLRTQFEVLQYPHSSAQQGLGSYFVHKVTPFPRATFFSNGKLQTVQLDDEALMSAVSQQKRERENAQTDDATGVRG